jgi:DNA invertase Pin-like site-specific DNA recombinase
MRRAFSYLRFSKSDQAEGDSGPRQIRATEAYCKRHGLILDKRTFTDLGVSAFRGGNATGGELAVFIELVKDGRIPKGSVLIVENTDRLSRLPPDKASEIICDLVRSGVDVVTTSPEAVYTADNIARVATWLPLQVACALAHEESLKKGERLREMWGEKRKAQANGEKVTRRCPFWLRLSADRTEYLVVEAKAAVVRRVFGLSLDGMGVTAITDVLNKEHPSGARGKGWHPGVVQALLRNPAVVGTFQPMVGTCAKRGGVKKTSRPHGDPIKNHFPAVIDETTFLLVQAGLDARRHGGGRAKGVPNLFSGLLKDAHDGHNMVSHGQLRKRKLLVSAGAIRKKPGCGFRAVPYDEFEEAVLRWLSELRVSDVVGPKNGAQAAVEAASGKLTAINHKIGQAQARVADADDPTVFLDLLDQLGTERKAAVKELEKAKQKAADEAGDTFGECCSLIALLADAAGDEREDLRRRTKAALRRLVKEAYVLPVRRSKFCLLVAAQFWFDGKRHRDFLIMIGRPGQWQSTSLPPDLATDVDLRKPRDAAKVAQGLESLDLAATLEALGENG